MARNTHDDDDDADDYIPGEDYGVPTLSAPASPLLTAGIAAIRSKRKQDLKALRRQRVLIGLINRPHTSLKTRVRCLEELEKSGWGGFPHWEKIRARAFWGTKVWQFQLGEPWLKRLDVWDQKDEKAGNELAAYLAERIQALLDANREFEEQITRYWELVEFEFFKFMAFEKYGIERSALWRLYRDYCFKRKPKGYKKFVQEGEGKGYLAAGDAVTQARQAISNKAAWDLLEKWKTLEGYIVTLWKRKIRKGDAPEKAQQIFERRLIFTERSDEATSSRLTSLEEEDEELEANTKPLKVGKPDPDYSREAEPTDQLVASQQIEEAINKIKAHLPSTKLCFTFETLLDNPFASDKEIALILRCNPQTVNNRREQIRNSLPPGLQRLLKELRIT